MFSLGPFSGHLERERGRERELPGVSSPLSRNTSPTGFGPTLMTYLTLVTSLQEVTLGVRVSTNRSQRHSSVHNEWLPVSQRNGFLIPIYLSSNSGLKPSLSIQKKAPPRMKKRPQKMT